MAGWNAENNTKLQALPVTHNVGPDPQPVDSSRRFGDHANDGDHKAGSSPRQR